MRGEFADILSLLPASKELLSKRDRKAEDGTEKGRSRAIPKTFQNWLQAFCIYTVVL